MKATIESIENKRLSIQKLCDGEKSAEERNRLGQFSTPAKLANEILSYSKSFFEESKKIRFLDPAFGTGSFYSALLHNFSKGQIQSAQGFEIDPHYAHPTIKLWKDTSLKIQVADFTNELPPKEKFNLIICNPPYVRHHHIPLEEKVRLQSQALSKRGIRLSGLSGFYCYFLLEAHEWLTEDGIAGWLIPSEFMDVNYGEPVKKYLLSQVELIQIHRYNPDDLQFDDALVSSCVVWFRKRQPTPDHKVLFTFGGSLTKPHKTKLVSIKELHHERKWSRIHEPSACNKKGNPTLADFFKIKRGIATGNNNFFILTREEVQKRNLPMKFFKPVLPSPRFVETNEIQYGLEGAPEINRQLFLLDCRLPEEEIKLYYPTLWDYLRTGKEDVAKQYLPMRRTPWYSQENRPAPPFVFTYMGRIIDGRSPFRFILNWSKATATNNYLLLYPKDGVSQICEQNPAFTKKLWELLNNFTANSLINEGRVYGGGLYKMEPKELANVPAQEIADLLFKEKLPV